MSITRSSPVQVAAFSTTYSQAPKLVSTSWSKVSVGPSHVLAIKSNNTLWAWGFNNLGQLGDSTTISRSSPVQIGNPSYTWNDISAGLNYSVGLRGDNLLFAWGLNTAGLLGDLNVPIGATRSSPNQIGASSWTQISAGGTHVVAIRSDRKLFTWGLNTLGQLGNGDFANRSSPVQISTSSWIQISAGNTHTAAITSDGKLFTWGDNTAGTLGYTTPDQPYYSWTTIAGNSDYTVAIRNDGLLFAWGTNNLGQLGDNSTINRSSPVQIGANSWTLVTANAPTGGGPVLAIRSDGTLWGWGYNTTGVLGVGDTANRSSPVQVSGGGSWIAVSASKSHSVAIKSDYNLYTWGLGTSGQLGDGLVSRSSPVKVGTSSWTKVSSGDVSSYAIRIDGGLFAWGSNINGQQGDITIATTVLRSAPTQIGLSSWTSVFAYGSTWVHAIDSNSKLFAWGLGTTGQLGYNDIVSRSSPVQISSGNFSTLGAYGTTPNTLAIQTDGSLWAWGSKTNLLLGEFSNTNYTYSWSQVSAGPSHTAAVRSDGRLYAWGLNNSGQLGNSSTVNTSSPVLITVTAGGSGEYWNRVSVNGLRTVAIRNDGTLWVWGSNAGYILGDGTSINRSAPVQITSVPGTWTAITAGLSHTLAIKSDSSLYAWGDNTYQQLGIGSTVTLRSQPVQITTPSISWSQVSSYGNHSLAVDVNNKLYSWGDNTLGQVGVSASPLQWIRVNNYYTTQIIRNDNIAYSMGLNNGGQIGDGTVVTRSSPVQLSGGGSWSQLVSGYDGTNNGYSIGIKTDGTLYTWGLNSSGILGDSTLATTVTRSSPVQVGTSSWISVSTMNNSAIAIRSDYTMWAWGKNDQGQLGDGTTVNKSAPVQIGTSSWTQISVGVSSAMGLTIDGTLYTWGLNTSGQLGDITTISKSSPIQIDTVNSYIQISGISSSKYAIRNDYTLWSWGLNSNGQLGDGTATSRSSPVQINTGQYYDLISSGADHAVGKRKDGTLWGWGFNSSGQVGDATLTQRNNPTQIGASSWVSVSAGYKNTFGITVSGGVNGLQNLYAWGYNTDGALGDNNTSIVGKSSPTLIASTTLIQLISSPTQIGTNSWTSISASLSNSFAIRSDFKLYSWGDNIQLQSGYITPATALGTASNPNNNAQSYVRSTDNALIVWGANDVGQIGDNSTVNRSSPVQIGLGFGNSQFNKIARAKVATAGYTLGIKTDGTLWSWGSGSSGATGNMETINRSSPVQIGTSTNWSEIAAGPSHALAIKSDGSLWGWGLNTNGQAGVLSWGQISVGSSHTLAIRSDGALFAWGKNDRGQLGVSSTTNRSSPVQMGTSSWKQVAAGIDISSAIRGDGLLFTWGYNANGALGLLDTANRSAPVQISVTGVDAPASLGSLSIGSSGSGQSFSIGSPAVTFAGDFTWECWAKRNAIQGFNCLGCYSTAGDAFVRLNNGAVGVGSIGWSFASYTYTAGTNTDGNTFAAANTWFHIAVVRIGVAANNVSLYINGQLIQQASSTATKTINLIGTYNNSSSQEWNGYISNFRVSNIGRYSAAFDTSLLVPLAQTTAPFITDTNTLLLVGTSSSSIADTSGNNVTVTANSSASASSQIPPIYSIVYSYPPRFDSISARDYILALANNKIIYGAGNNSAGQLGLNYTANRSTPIQIGSSSWVQISAGTGHALGILTDNTLYAWGTNNVGQLGLNDIANRSNPVQVSTSNYSQVSAGNSHSLAVANDGKLFSWGNNYYSQLGLGDTINRSSPVQVNAGTSYTHVDAGTNYSIALKNDNTIWAWGDSNSKVYTGPDNLNWSVVTNSGGIHSDYTLWSWGVNTFGQLGVSDTITRSSPVQIGTTSWTVFVSTLQNSYAIKNDGSLWAWGRNDLGQLGLGDSVNRSSPVQVSSGTSWTTVSASIYGTYTLGVTTTGALYAWGDNSYGQLGLNDTILQPRSTPVQVGASSWTKVSAGGQHTLAVRSDGLLYGWGRSDQGQVSQNIGLSWSSVSTGISFNVALRNDGKLFSWGQNDKGQLGLGDTINRSYPVQIPTQSNVTYYSYYFGGSGGPHFSIADNAAFAITTNSASVEMWVYFFKVDTPAYQTLAGQNASTSSSLRLGLDAGGTIRYSTTGDVSHYSYPIAANTWYHLLVTYNGGTSQQARFFINGMLHHTLTALTTIPDIAGVYEFGGEDGNSFNGYISNFRFCNGSIPTDYVTTSTVAGTQVFTPSSTPLTTTSQGATAGNVKILTCQSSTIRDNSPNNWAITFVRGPLIPVTENPFLPYITPNNSWTQVSAGNSHVLAVRSDGGLFTWGDNSRGQLGDPSIATTVNRSFAIQIGSDSWSQVAGALNTSLAIRTDNRLYAWGANTGGQVADSTTVDKSSPVQVTGSWNQVNGSTHVLAIKSDGTLWGWGQNTAGQIGDGSVVDKSSPVSVGANTWSKISAGSSFSMAIRSDGLLFTWGLGSSGQLGGTGVAPFTAVADKTNKSSPIQIGAGTWGIVSGGQGWAAAINTAGQLFTWGVGATGELGSGATTPRSSPVQVGSSSWSALAAGKQTSGANGGLGITTTGALFTWGVGTAGQLGDNTTVTKSAPTAIAYTWTALNKDVIASPVQITTSSFTQVSAGNNHSMALRITDGALFTWGMNTAGQLGSGVTTNRSSPTQVGVISYTVITSGAVDSSAGIDNLNRLYAWGIAPWNGIAGNRSAPTQIGGSSWISVSAGRDILFGIQVNTSWPSGVQSSGVLFAWGDGRAGQTGQSSRTSTNSPVQVGTYVQTLYSNPVQISSTNSPPVAISNNYGIFFDGSSSYILVADSSPLNLAGGSWTVEMWFNHNGDYSTYMVLFAKRSISTTSYEGALDINSGNILYYNGTVYNSNITPAPNTWHHIAYVYNGTNIIIYLNGVNIYSTAVTITNQAVPLVIGAFQNAATPTYSEYFKGYISNFRLVKGVAVYTGNFTVPTSILTTTQSAGTNISAITGTQTSLLTLQNGYLVDNSTNQFVFTFAGLLLVVNSNLSVIPTISVSESHTAIISNGWIFETGDNTVGQIGDSTTVSKSNVTLVARPTLFDNRSSPAQIGTGSWSQIAAGLNYSIALKSDGTLYTWGVNTTGQLGDGTTFNRATAQQIGTSSFIAISAGAGHTLALEPDLTLYAWGLNNAGQLGDNSTTNRSSPVQVNTGLVTSWNFISAGVSHSSAIDATNNFPYGWGLNSSGQIGDNTTVNKSSPAQVSISSATNYSLLFNGTTQYLTIASNAAFGFGTGDFTIEAWIYINNATGINLYDSRTTQLGNGINMSITGSPPVPVYRPSGVNQITGSSLSFNTWYHIAYVRISGVTKMYVNGTQSGSSYTDTQNIATAAIKIGANYNVGSLSDGYISNMRIIKGTGLYTSGFYPSTGALTTTSQGVTASQVSLLTAQSLTIVDNSTNAFTITNTGTVTVSSSNPYGPYYSASFNGTSQYLSLAGTSLQFGSNSFTIETWVYPTGSNSTQLLAQMGSQSTRRYALRMLPSGVGYQISWWQGSGLSAQFTNSTVISKNTWTHVAFVKTASTITIYINGVGQSTSFSSAIAADTTTLHVIGTNQEGGSAWYLTGYLSNFRVVNGTAVYTGNFTAPTNILRTTQSASTNIVALTGTETSLLTLQNATIVDNSATPLTITNNGTVTTTTAFAPFSASVAGANTTWDTIQAGITSTMGTSNNTLYTWGAGTGGQLGDSTTVTKSAPVTTGVGSIWSVQEKLLSSPVQVGTAKSWSLVGAGAVHTIARATDFTLWTWGQNNVGQLGDSTTVGKSSPTQVPGNVTSYSQLTAGSSNIFAINAINGLLYGVGLNSAGQLGDTTVVTRSGGVQIFTGTMTSPLIPLRLNTVSGSSYTLVQAGSAASVIDSTGSLFIWGTNTNGQVGDNTVVNRSSPVQLGGLTGFTYIQSPTQVGSSSYSQVSAGSSHTLAIDSNSLLYAWGKTPANGQSVNRSSPVQIGSNSWLFVSAGIDASQAIDSTRTLYTWGLNTNYQLGSSNFVLNQSVSSPVAIGTLAIQNSSRTTSVGSGNGGFIKNI